MSNREDYLDSLLKSVTTSEEEKTSSKLDSDDEFLMKFEQDLLDLDDDDFLKEFEMVLEEKPELEEYEEDIEVDTMNQDSDDLMVNTMEQDDFPGLEPEAMKDDIDAMLMAAMGAAEFETQETDQTSEPEAELDFGFGFESESEELPENEPEDDASELLDILAGMSEDDDLAEIGNMLKAHDADELLDAEELTDEMDVFGMEDSDMTLEDMADGEEQSGKKGKKKKKGSKDGKESGGFFKKMANAFFGEDDDVVVPEAGELGNISSENMEILRDMEKKEKKAQKKQEKKEKKEQKKQEKQEKKEQKKQEKALKASQQEKKPKEPEEKTKPLPKAPVFLIFVLVASVVVLIYLGSNLVGYSIGMTEAESKYDQGDYVEAYQLLRGMEIKEVDKEFYNKTRLTAYVKKEWDSYKAYVNREMYPEALDALICAVGKYDKHSEDAAAVGAGAEFGSMFGDVEAALTQTFGVTIEEAREVYKQQSRESYTVQLYELLERAGLAE